MEDGDRPGSPSPALIEEYANDPDVAGLKWEDVSTLHACYLDEPSKLPSPCEKFNKGTCLSRATCPRPHVCSLCSHANHSAITCSTKACSSTRPKDREGRAWTEDMSYSPCSKSSLDATPLPRPPPRSELPPALVQIVDAHPELFTITTPINVDSFESLLTTHPNQPFVRSVIIGLREGFWPYATAPRVLPDESRRQKRLFGPKQEFLDKYVQEEIRSSRFSRSFGTRLLDGMGCMPVHVGDAHGKFRLTYDHSAGEHALNALIPKEERSAPTDRIDALIHVLRSRQLDLADIVLFKSDVSRAFRNLPMSPYWQAMQAVKINGLFYIDRCNTFGNAGSQRLFCAFYSLVLWIAENVWRVPDICCYVDDNFSWDHRRSVQYYKRHGRYYPTKQARLLELWDILGIPHAAKKQEFGQILTITGFHVDLKRMRVTVSNERLEKVFSSLSEFCSASSMTLNECQKFAGSVNWVLEVNPLLRPGITPLHKAMMKVDPKSSTTRVAITASVKSGMRWLEGLLRESRGVHISGLSCRENGDAAQVAYVCASTEGLGFWFPIAGRAFYHRFTSPEPAQLISHAHTFAVLCALYFATGEWRKYSDGLPGRLKVFTADKSTVDMFSRLHALEEFHDIILLAIKYLVKADMDLMISRSGNEDDFAFAARLSRDTKENLVADFPNVTMREFDIPPRLARRARWVAAPAERRFTSRSGTIHSSSQSSTTVLNGMAKTYMSNGLDAAVPEPSMYRKLLGYLTGSFR